MGTLIDITNLSKSFGARPLFQGVRFSIEDDTRIGLIGPNGAGKSTLLQILMGSMEPDGGEIRRRRGVRLAFLEQQPKLLEHGDVRDNILAGALDSPIGDSNQIVDELMSRFRFDQIGPHTSVETLSGGWRKRVALAREVARQPDLLFLDEPTNHLDIQGIIWLEEYLKQASFSIVTITHDRLFLQNVATKILELDRRNPDGLMIVEGDYATYLARKEALLQAQEQQEQSLRNKLRRETEWLRRGAKARSTKQKARIDRAESLATDVKELQTRNVSHLARLDFQSAETSIHRLIEVHKAAKSYGNRLLFSKLSLLITAKSRIGLLGENGCGKSTLIKVILGQEPPDMGTVKHSDQLSVAYFEQGRETLNPRLPLIEALAPDGDQVFFGGRYVHVRSYLDRFLFTSEQMQLPCGSLSGGEQSRLLLARLMLTKANLLVLDEPTNDLDIATLNLLEECLVEFTGAVLLVSHDRYFLDQVASEIIAFGSDQKGTPLLTTYASLEQWENANAALAEQEKRGLTKSDSGRKSSRSLRLTYNEQRELAQMEQKIEAAESRREQLRQKSLDPAVFSSVQARQEVFMALAEADREVDCLYQRWAELEAKK